MVKRILSLILILLLVSTVSFAEELSISGEISIDEEISFEENTQTVLKTSGVNKGETIGTFDENAEADGFGFFANIPFDEYIALFVEEHIAEYGTLPTEITGLASYQIHEDDIGDTFYDAVLRHPETLLTTGGFSYGYNSERYVTRIIPNYIVDNDGIEDAREAIENGIQSYVDFAQDYGTDLEKLLAIHDKMVEECVYDDRVMSNDPTVVAQAPATVYHALGVFRDKFAVCQGYSQATYVIGKRLGIEMDFCDSDEKNHMWNYVKLDGKWYYYDMTNDDPADTQGRASHTYFLFSEERIVEGAHGTDYARYGGGESPVCDDTTYDKDHFFNLPILFKGYKDADGCYNASINLRITSQEINTTVTFKSPTLYTGAIIVAPIITYGKYSMIEDGETVSKTGTNLYTLEYSVGEAPSTFLILKYGNRFVRNSDRAAVAKGKSFMRIIQPDAEGMDLTRFTSFVFGTENLTPYSTKYNWK